jgi:hypothetical protein
MEMLLSASNTNDISSNSCSWDRFQNSKILVLWKNLGMNLLLLTSMTITDVVDCASNTIGIVPFTNNFSTCLTHQFFLFEQNIQYAILSHAIQFEDSLH